MDYYLTACLAKERLIIFAGRMTIGSSTSMTLESDLLATLLGNGYKNIILDLSRCDYMDGSGIGTIISTMVACEKAGGTFALNRCSKKIVDLITLTKVINNISRTDIDYSEYQHISISTRDLSALNIRRSSSTPKSQKNVTPTSLIKAAPTSKLTTFNFLITLYGDRLLILPGRQEGIYRLSLSDHPTEELIIGMPYVVANVTRSFLETEIEEFQEIINSPNTVEHDIQKFLETHPKFILGHEYCEIYSQVILDRDGHGPLIPDFLIQPYDRELCDIIELKLPNVPLIVGKDNRKRFSSAIAEAAAQLRAYRDYFDDPAKREAVKNKYGISAFRPKLAVIIGRTPELDPILCKKIQSGLQDVDVVTYDDLIQRAKRFLL